MFLEMGFGSIHSPLYSNNFDDMKVRVKDRGGRGGRGGGLRDETLKIVLLQFS